MDERFSKLLTSIYGTVLDRNCWEDMLDSLAEYLGARAAVLVLREQAFEHDAYACSSKVFRDDKNGIFSYYMENLVQHEAPAWEYMAKAPAGLLVEDIEAFHTSAAELDLLPNYSYSLEKLDIRRRASMRLNDTPGWFDAVAMSYGSDVLKVSDLMGYAAAQVAPHLARAIEINRSFALLRKQFNAVISALDRFGIGVCITLGSSEVLVANSEADRLLGEKDAIQLSPTKKLRCRSAEATAQLGKAIERASLTAKGQDAVLAAPLTLDRQSLGTPILADVAPLNDVAADIETGFFGAVVFLIDMARPPALDYDRFSALNGLSAAEKSVLKYLITGKTVREISEIRSTSFETVRSQNSSILSKCRCRNRSELLRLMIKTLPPIIIN